MKKSELRQIIKEEIRRLNEDKKDELQKELKKANVDIKNLVLINRKNKSSIDVYSKIDVYRDKNVKNIKVAKKILITEVPYDSIKDTNYVNYISD